MYAQHFCLPGGIYDWADDLYVAQVTVVIGGSLDRLREYDSLYWCPWVLQIREN